MRERYLVHLLVAANAARHRAGKVWAPSRDAET